MANVKAVASGNWSNTATWDGGVLPTVNDDVFSNTFTVTIDGTFTVLSIRNTAATGITAGGQFKFANGGNLTCTASNSIEVAGSTPTLLFDLTSGNSGTFSGSIISLTAGISGSAISQTGTGTFNLTGNFDLNNGTTTRVIFSISGAGTINHVGNIVNSSSGTSGGAGTAAPIVITANCTYNHTGNCTGGGTNSLVSGSSIRAVSTAFTYNGTGDLLANLAPSIYTTQSATINVIGNVTGTTSFPSIHNITNSATINVNGIITAGTSYPAISGLVTTLVKVQGTIINQGTYNAIYAGRITLEGNIAYWQYRNALNNTSTNLYTVGALNYPDELDVRDGIDYGASLELTGTLAVPTADNVRKGVPIDDTVGTADLTAEDFLTAIEESTLDIAERLRNVATVQTTGDQVVGLS